MYGIICLCFSQGASPKDGEVYANMARQQLNGAQDFDADEAGGGGGPWSSCGNRIQQKVRADLMLSVLYDMLGRYDESDTFLDSAYEVRGVGEEAGGVGVRPGQGSQGLTFYPGMFALIWHLF